MYNILLPGNDECLKVFSSTANVMVKSNVRIYSTCASSSFFKVLFCLFVCFILAFCHVDIDVCIYRTCAFLIVKRILMLIMYNLWGLVL